MPPYRVPPSKSSCADTTGIDETVLILMRLRFNGSASRWGFAIYLASTGKYEDSMLPTGDFTAVSKTHSTQHAGSASVIRPPGNYPRRTNGSDH